MGTVDKQRSGKHRADRFGGSMIDMSGKRVAMPNQPRSNFAVCLAAIARFGGWARHIGVLFFVLVAVAPTFAEARDDKRQILEEARRDVFVENFVAARDKLASLLSVIEAEYPPSTPTSFRALVSSELARVHSELGNVRGARSAAEAAVYLVPASDATRDNESMEARAIAVLVLAELELNFDRLNAAAPLCDDAHNLSLQVGRPQASYIYFNAMSCRLFIARLRGVSAFSALREQAAADKHLSDLYKLRLYLMNFYSWHWEKGLNPEPDFGPARLQSLIDALCAPDASSVLGYCKATKHFFYGTINRFNSRVELAADEFEKAFKSLNTLPIDRHDPRKIIFCHSLANAVLAAGNDLENASACLADSADIIEFHSLSETYWSIFNHNYLGITSFKKGNFPKAEYHFSELISIGSVLYEGEPSRLEAAFRRLARVKLSMGKQGEAEYLKQEADRRAGLR